jgi:hypothetical protein
MRRTISASFHGAENTPLELLAVADASAKPAARRANARPASPKGTSAAVEAPVRRRAREGTRQLDRANGNEARAARATSLRAPHRRVPAMHCVLHAAAVLLATSLAGTSAPAQGVLDVLDGETLYEGGFLFTVGFELNRGDKLRQGEQRVGDPLAAHEVETRTTLALQYGLRNNLQLGIALPYVGHERAGIGFEQDADGVGDLNLLGKWRFYRWDAPGEALNVAVLTELSLPTGDDDAAVNGVRLEPELQPGSGGVDPAVGLGGTYEPGRWRFNAATLYRFHTDTDGDDTRLGDELVAELAVGNRFWLEPYPGPFMRADIPLRYYWEDESRQSGPLDDTGGERATVGLNVAFRPRPSLDFQLSVELPVWQRVNGTQLGDDWGLDFTFGYRF